MMWGACDSLFGDVAAREPEYGGRSQGGGTAAGRADARFKRCGAFSSEQAKSDLGPTYDLPRTYLRPT